MSNRLSDGTFGNGTGDCPRCAGPVPNGLDRGRYPGALSRKDNDTEVCSGCGVDEALRQFTGKDPWPGFPSTIDYEAAEVTLVG